MAEVVAEKGYAAASVADVIGRAGVSRSTFYVLFVDKQDCFLAACTMATELMTSMLTEAIGGCAQDATPLERLDRLVEVYLATIASSPALARAFLVEVYAGGSEAVRRRRDAMEDFVDLVAVTHRGEAGLVGTDPRQRFAIQMLVSAVSSMVTTAVALEDTAELPSLRERLSELARQLLSD
jgi:AcrR family transcriptional regulator